jgi:hypothetical protein
LSCGGAQLAYFLSFPFMQQAATMATITIECASDYFISSYTPTIGVLLTHDCPPSSSTERFEMMAVISRELPSTRMELEKIERHVPSESLVKFGIPGATASVEAVATKLSDVAIAHFACHGTQDQSNPLNSGLKFEDGWLRVSRIMKEKIPNGALGFFVRVRDGSGCRKAPGRGDELGGVFTLCWIRSCYCYNVVSFAFVDCQLSFPLQWLI